MIYQPWKEGFYLTSVGIDMSLYLVLTSRTEVNGVALYFKILLAGYLTASNEGSFTDEKLLFSAWFTLFLCMNIHSLFFFFLRIDMNSQTFSSSFLYDLIIYCIIRRYKAWSVSLHFKIHFYLHAHVPSLDSVGMYSVTFVLLRLTRPEQIWP